MSEIQVKLLSAVDQLPAFPKSVQQVLTLSQDVNCSPKELVDVIKHDPIFTMKIIKLVNSPFIGLRQKITSIQQASVYLGLNTLKNMALSLATIGSLPRKNKAGFSMDAFWLHSLAVAAITKKLAEQQDVSRAGQEDLFSAGLLHDVGKVVFAVFLSEEFKTVMDEVAAKQLVFHETEANIIGADHAAMGAMVADKWDLPETLTAIIAGHHNTERADPELNVESAIDCIATADLVCKKISFGGAGSVTVEPVPVSAAARFGANIDAIIESIPNLDKELDKTRIFIEV